MQNISELKAKFNRLPVNKENWELYQRLLDLDMSVFKPLMEEILEGRMDIEDTRPIFGGRLISAIRSTRFKEKKRKIVETDADLRKNLALRATNPEMAIKEVRLQNREYDEAKSAVIESFERDTGRVLTDGERRALAIALDEQEDVDVDLYDSKERQTRLSDMLSGGPS